jgi:two-component system, LytTR family, sensor kinase
VSGITTGVTTVKLIRLSISFACTILITEGSRLLVYRSRRFLNGRLRLVAVIAAGLAWTSLILALSILFRKMAATGVFSTNMQIDTSIVLNNRKLVTGLLGYAFLDAVFAFPVLLVAYETLYYYARLQYTEKQKEKLEKEKLKAELQQLKGIINPHFLFNNLNSLSSLIIEDPVQAQDFLDELTKVFRYLLRNNDTELTPLSQELKFIQSYYHLLQTRYGKAIVMEMNIDSDYEELMIPPLTLQLLIENAVKHNRIQKEKPLKIELSSAPGNKLVISNNLCRKESDVESIGIGLQNINARYRMLDQPELVIEQMDNNFQVILTLVKDSPLSSSGESGITLKGNPAQA